MTPKNEGRDLKMTENVGRFLILWVLVIVALSGNYAAAKPGDDFSDVHKQEFGAIERRLSYNPDDLKAGNRLREICRSEKSVPVCIKILNDLTQKYPKNKTLRYHAALAYVDQVPGHTLFKQGWYSTRSMDHMSEILKDDPTDWSALYIRGLNGIFWPNSFRRLPGAIKDLEKCIELSTHLPDGLKKPYHTFAYIALGDAHVKNGSIDQGLQVYKQGLEIHDSKRLEKRVSFKTNDELIAYVLDVNDRNKPVDTDITFLLDGGLSKL